MKKTVDTEGLAEDFMEQLTDGDGISAAHLGLQWHDEPPFSCTLTPCIPSPQFNDLKEQGLFASVF